MADYLATDQIALPIVWEDEVAAPRGSTLTMVKPTTKLSEVDREVARKLGLSPTVFANAKIAKQARVLASKGSGAVQKVTSMLRITQGEFAKAKVARMQRASSGDAELREKLGDLKHAIGILQRVHASGGRSSIALAMAATHAARLEDHLFGSAGDSSADEGDEGENGDDDSSADENGDD